ncbi:hypothetical protein HCJ58_01105 [Listeria sp. FSL L7-1509]|uniref:Prophage pi2 protein 40 n=1 Tax=Listeria immobilis TaxID=2713502 RepID=A0ABR6STH5_9LIST|nr:hypothetical protein [Listeria immobilis]MBC1505585.1 hypothetical protein [Listeria immobilis]MBC1508981.1 hypothetical protein [Listeria immobilis]MBC6302143.1 hypothetical protein [Listeria immobilis]
MEKTIEVDGKKIPLKSTGATVLRYKQQFGKDYFSELMKMTKAIEPMKKNKKMTNLADSDLSLLDFEVLYNFVWVLAKTANPNIPEPLEWLDGFDSFPIVDIMPDIEDLLAASIQTKKK